jgi:adenine-specific DNA-methyltransferase
MGTSDIGPGTPGALTVIEIESRRRFEQERLDRLKTLEERNRLGQFATPPALALDIARYAAVHWQGRSDQVAFLDPAIGSGSFYSALRQTFPTDIVSDACGVEIDPGFAGAAQALWEGTGLRVIQGDFTRLDPDRKYNLILTNPPYVRHHHLAREDKERLKDIASDRLGVGISGLAGLYAHFLLMGDAWLADGGLAIWLIPSEFMDVNYGVALKSYLTERVSLRQIHRYCPSDVQFCDALVTSAIVVFDKMPPPHGHEVRMSFSGPLSTPATSESVSLATLRSTKKWTAFPGNGARRIAPATTLGDFFTIKRGVATGANAFFILERAEARRRGIPEIFLKPILPSSRHLRQDVIEADADGYPRLDRPLVLIDCDLSEDVLRDRYPDFWSYLQEGRQQGVHSGYLASRRSPWYAQEQRNPAPFLCTYMGRQGVNGNPFRFFRNQSRAIAANVYLLLYPKAPLKLALDRSPDLGGAVFSRLQAITADHLIGEGRVYGGGLHKLEPKELSSLPADAIAQVVNVPSPARQRELAL